MLLESQAAGPSRRAQKRFVCPLRHRPAAAKSLEAVPEPFAVVWVNPSLCSGQGFCEVPRFTNSQNVSRCLRVLRAIRCYQPAKCLEAVPEGFVTHVIQGHKTSRRHKPPVSQNLPKAQAAGPSRRAQKRVLCALRHRPATYKISRRHRPAATKDSRCLSPSVYFG